MLLAWGLMCLVSCGTPWNAESVDGKVWRSPQPNREEFSRLKQQGVGEVLNLRQWNSDDGEAEGLVLHRVRMNAGDIGDEQMLEALLVLTEAESPVLVHCWHGADRTGVVVAMYRMVVQRWSRERAIAELMEPRFGHHAAVYPNIREYLESVDIDAMRRRLAEARETKMRSKIPAD
ncbi:MAG: tyrosine-protein phosphatase [Akkermansiaceae bacterium]|nr:tyrosine-protein phosphatase [Akkermansiaceae bacterium]